MDQTGAVVIGAAFFLAFEMVIFTGAIVRICVAKKRGTNPQNRGGDFMKMYMKKKIMIRICILIVAVLLISGTQHLEDGGE